MGAMQRRKGAVAERELVQRLHTLGFPEARRTAQMQSQRGATEDDVLWLPELYVECRRRETLNIPAWCREVDEKSGDRVGVLAFRRSNEPWSLRIRLDEAQAFARIITQRSTL
jgi:hypothetical protein